MANTLPLHCKSSKTMTQLNTPAFEARVQELLDKWHVPGISIALIKDNETTSRGFGKATIDPPQPCTSDTLYDIASCSKSLTAAAIAILVEDDHYPTVAWSSKMCNLLPEDFVLSQDRHTQDVTLEDILSHRTGLPSHDLSYLSVRARHPDTPRSLTRNLRNLPITDDPIRTKFHYCNIMFTVATHLIEVLTGKSFEDFLHAHFFAPLGMTSSHLQPPAAIAAGLGERIATPYKWVEDGKTYRKVPLQNMPESQGAGQILTSVGDYVKYVKAFMCREGPITRDVYSGVMKIRILCEEEDEGRESFTSARFYAAGWEVMWYRGYKIVQHAGGVPGFGSLHFFLPGVEFGGVLVGNSDEAGSVAGILAREMIDEVLGVEEEERRDWDEKFVGEMKEYEEGKGSMAEKLCPGMEEVETLTTPLEEYVGAYWNDGYREMVVEVKDGELFIDASDRSMGFYLTLRHVCGQTTFVGHMRDYYDGTEEELAVQFEFENGKVVKLGVKDEETYDEYVWYQRMLQ